MVSGFVSRCKGLVFEVSVLDLMLRRFRGLRSFCTVLLDSPEGFGTFPQASMRPRLHAVRKGQSLGWYGGLGFWLSGLGFKV